MGISAKLDTYKSIKIDFWDNFGLHVSFDLTMSDMQYDKLTKCDNLNIDYLLKKICLDIDNGLVCTNNIREIKKMESSTGLIYKNVNGRMTEYSDLNK